MPHIVLEYSANIIEKRKLSDLFEMCHITLAETLPTEIANCKSRAIKHDDYFLGAGLTASAFVHLDIKVMPGRDLIKLQGISQQILEVLKRFFKDPLEKLNLQISVEIGELKETYVKFNSGGR